MRARTLLTLSFLAPASLLASAASADHVSDGKWTFATALTDSAEVGGGDSTMSGTFTMTVNPGDKQVCYTFNITSTALDPSDDDPTMAHIHVGAEGTAGPPVITLVTPDIGTNPEQCTTATSRQLAQLIAKPENFYVNVHTAAFGAGAIRGQFERPDH